MKKSGSIYSVHPSVAMVQSSVRKLAETTGKTIDEWVAFVKKSGPPSEKERREWLKKEHGFGTNYAWWVAERAEGRGWEDSDPAAYLKAAEEYVENMFVGSKAGLRPIYESLLNLGLSMGSDVKACPCKTIVPFYRKHVFAEIKPTTRTRIDLGFALKDTPLSGRLVDTGGFEKKNRITRRIGISSLEDIDDEVRRWLVTAYEMDK
jgi:hypothetical protein